MTAVGVTDSVQELRGSLGVPVDISSPITSDEEYLSPLEEGLDFGGPELQKSLDAKFRCPPAFLVSYVTKLNPGLAISLLSCVVTK